MKFEFKKLERNTFLVSCLVGKTCVSSLQFNIERKTLIVTNLFTPERHRRKGYAKKLLRYLKRIELTEKKIHQLVTEIDNFAAQKLYESEGFKKILTGAKYIFYERYPEN